MNWRNCRASLHSRPKGCHDPVMKGKASSRILYYFLTACIFVAAVLVYKAWWDRYFRLRPELAVAEPAVLSLDVPMDGVLIWEENILVSPVDGTLHFPAGRGPFYCARGDVVAELVSASGKRQVKAPAPGYFMAALDGSEGNWSYGLLWPGSSRLPVTGPLEFLEEGTNITSGRPLGKFIPQPQPLRCVSHVAKAAIGWDPSKRNTPGDQEDGSRSFVQGRGQGSQGSGSYSEDLYHPPLLLRGGPEVEECITFPSRR